MKNLLKKFGVEKWLKQSCMIGFIAIPLALASCAKEEDDEETRDFDLGDGTFKLTKIEGNSVTLELNEGSTFGVEVEWVLDSTFNVKYVGKGSVDFNGDTYKMSCDSNNPAFQWQGINDNGFVKKLTKVFLREECPVGFADMFTHQKFASIKIITEGIDDGFLVEVKNGATPDILYFEDDVRLISRAGITTKLHFSR